MTQNRIKAYRFATPAQWRSCTLRRFDLGSDGTLAPCPTFGAHPFQIVDSDSLSLVATDGFGTLYCRQGMPPEQGHLLRLIPSEGNVSNPFEGDSLLATSPRWIISRTWLWAFDGSKVCRYDLDRFQPDLLVDTGHSILDIAADGRDGLWVLVSKHGMSPHLLHIDCAGRRRDHRLAAPLCDVSQLASTEHGQYLLLLSGQFLFVLDGADHQLVRQISVSEVTADAGADCLSSDGMHRAILWSRSSVGSDRRWSLSVLDGSAELLELPLVDRNLALPDSLAHSPNDIAIGGGAIWFATQDGLWQLDTTESSVARESESTLLTPVLRSPEVGTDKGWLRAELRVALSPGALLEVSIASTADPNVQAAVQNISDDPNLTAASKQRSIWEKLTSSDARRFSFLGPALVDTALAVPLFEVTDQWLWLRVRIVVPPGESAAQLRELRVLYPNVSLIEHLPSIFRGSSYDPTGFMRRLVGVLETTTQSIDERIRSIGPTLDATDTTEEWLDYLGRWLDLPWDDALALDAKRRLLNSAPRLLALRGTRLGLQYLLRALIGESGLVHVTDLNVDSPPGRLGGDGMTGPTLPLLLAGASPSIALLNGQARLDAARLGCTDSDGDPLAHLIPTIRIDLSTSRQQEAILGSLLPDIVAEYVPAGVQLVLHWQTNTDRLTSETGVDVLDGLGPGALDDDGVLGRTVLAGRRINVIDDTELDARHRLQ